MTYVPNKWITYILTLITQKHPLSITIQKFAKFEVLFWIYTRIISSCKNFKYLHYAKICKSYSPLINIQYNYSSGKKLIFLFFINFLVLSPLLYPLSSTISLDLQWLITLSYSHDNTKDGGLIESVVNGNFFFFFKLIW